MVYLKLVTEPVNLAESKRWTGHITTVTEAPGEALDEGRLPSA
jgi:hypothetical protein